MLVQEVFDAMTRLAPLSLREDWDNVGLLAGDPRGELSGPVLLTIDLTEAVVEEALRIGAGCVIAYHPPIFSPIKRITPDTRVGRTLLRLLGSERPCPIFSPHTALDAAAGGLADWLLDVATGAAGDAWRRAITPAQRRDPNQTHKLVVFVPEDARDAVATALADAGAGVIGNYDHCAFTIHGEGTFRPGEGARPAIGQPGRIERAPELRLEAVCPGAQLAGIVEALRRAHPYEEPAFDILSRADVPNEHVGAGRLCELKDAIDARDLAQRLRGALGVESVRLALAPGAPTMLRRVGACPGSGGSLLDGMRQPVELFVTGEMSHHGVLGALERGTHVLLAGHTNTERPYLPILRERLAGEGVDAEIVVSEADRWPLEEVRG